jgi:hypothetical protein
MVGLQIRVTLCSAAISGYESRSPGKFLAKVGVEGSNPFARSS